MSSRWDSIFLQNVNLVSKVHALMDFLLTTDIQICYYVFLHMINKPSLLFNESFFISVYNCILKCSC